MFIVLVLFHHRRWSFKDKYLAWLKKFEVSFQEKYVFKFI